MCKKCFLVGILTLLSVSLAIADPPAVHPVTGEPLVIDCLRGTPDAIDGDLSDWNLEAMTPAVLDVAEQLHSGQDSWAGPEDCSGEFYLMWDDVNIYMAVVAKDDVLSMNKSDGSIWNADAVEVFFSTLNAVAGHDEHYQYGFNANNQRWNWCNMDGTGNAEPGYLQIASLVTADGYICEASVEYGQMPSLDFSAGNSIGFHAVFDDTDIVDGDRELQMTWTGREAHDQSLGYGHMVLSADPVPEPAEKTVLFAEDFEGVVLGPNIDEALAGDAVWTDTPPEGWIVDESGIPGLGLDATDGVTEWAGWAFVDKAWWIEAAEDQDRSLFELGSGVVAVADPDEWDDAERLPIPISADPYDTWLTTPAIKISAAEPGTLELKFDSSWRPEFDDNYHQTASITASFDGGDPVEVLLWESDEASPNFHPYATNETVVVDLDAPADARSVVLTFGLFDAGNDWWWAIDNIEVRGVVPDLGPVKPSTEGLVAYYAMDGDATDGSGNGLDGTLVGDPDFVDGIAGMALDLDGDGDYVDCSNNELFTITDAFTLSVWINWRTPTGSWQTVIAKGDNAWRLARGGDTQTMDFGFTDGGPRGWLAARTASEVPLGEWHHVVATIDTIDGAKIYLDGVLEGENPDTGGITVGSVNYPVLIGENAQATGRFWDGLIDEVMIYSRVLSDAEIRYLAGERAMPVDPGDNGLLAWWSCDEGEGNIVGDISGNGRDGIFVNGDPAWIEGVYGTAVELVGPTLIETPPLDLELSEATMAGWILPNGPQPDWSSFIMQRDPGLATGFNILGYQLAYHWNDTSDSWSFRGGDMIAEDDWTFAAVTIEPDKATFYVNGEQGSSNFITHEPCLWNSNVYLGGDGTEGWVSRRMNGALDDVVMYDRALSAGEIRYLAGIREFKYDGGELDEMWDHDNGSDQWDETGPGEGNPGGSASLTEDDVTFLRIQDTGDPRDYGMSDPGSNRKVYLNRLTDISLDGLILEVRMRVATTAPLDDQHPDGGAGIAPWPAEGLGYHIRDGGKGMIGVSDGIGIISFSLAQAGEPMFEDVTTDVLIMNSLVGTEPTSDVDTEDAAAAVALNMMAIDDATQWNTFVIDIVAGGAGTHVVTVSANGGPAESFDVTLGSDLEADGPYITIGSSGTGGITAFDVDYLEVKN
jgi:hypothetical protein